VSTFDVAVILLQKLVVSMAMVVYGLTRVHLDAVMSIKQTVTVDLFIFIVFLFPFNLLLKRIAGKSAAVKAGESVFMFLFQLLMKSVAGKPANVKDETVKGLLLRIQFICQYSLWQLSTVWQSLRVASHSKSWPQ